MMRRIGPSVFVLAGLLAGCAAEREPDLVVYAAMDRATAEPLVAEFERRTGRRVACVFDSESAKTAGLARRLEIERAAPRADVWWSGEGFHTALLSRKGLFAPPPDGLAAPEGSRAAFSGPDWTAAGVRLRVLVWSRETWPKALAEPAGLDVLADPRLAGRCAMARPLGGTSTTHAAALAANEEGLALLRRIRANGVLLVGGNAHVVEAVVRGQAFVGLTDSDDVLVARARHPDLAFSVPDQQPGGRGTVATACTAAVVRGAPREALAREFVRFLASAEAEAILARGPARHVPLDPTVPPPPELPRLDHLRLAAWDASRAVREWESLRKTVAEVFGP